MAGFSLEVHFTDFFQKVPMLSSAVHQAATMAVYSEAEHEMTMAKELTPVDTGALRASGHVEPPEWFGTVFRVSLGFGGPAVEYALRVHEDLNMYHTVGQAKFLETPVREEVGSGRAGARIQAMMSEALSRL